MGAKRRLPEPEIDIPNNSATDYVDVFGAFLPGYDEKQSLAGLADEFVWTELCEKVLREQKPTIWWVSSKLRKAWRDETGPGRYGKRGTPANLKEAVRLETLHAVRVAKLLERLRAHGLAWQAVAPYEEGSVANPFVLDEWVQLSQQAGVQSTVTPGMHVEDTHYESVSRICFAPAHGEPYQKPSSMPRTTHSGATHVRVGYWGNVLVRSEDAPISRTSASTSAMPPPTYGGLIHEHDLRPGAHVDLKKAEEEAVIGGLKRPSKAVLQIPGLGIVGEISQGSFRIFGRSSRRRRSCA